MECFIISGHGLHPYRLICSARAFHVKSQFNDDHSLFKEPLPLLGAINCFTTNASKMNDC